MCSFPIAHILNDSCQVQLDTAKSQYWLHKAGASPEHVLCIYFDQQAVMDSTRTFYTI